MGSSSSRLCPRPPRTHRTKNKSLSSLLLCGGSCSHAPVEGMEEDPTEVLIHSAQHSDPVVRKLHTEEPILDRETEFSTTKIISAASPESDVIITNEDPLPATNVGTGNEGKLFSESKELVPPHPNRASTSYEDQLPPDRPMMPCHVNIQDHIDSCSDVASVDDHAGEGTSVHVPGSSSASIESNDSLRDENIQAGIIPTGLGLREEENQRDGGILFNVVSISSSSNILSSTIPERNNNNNREARRNSRRLFWDAFSRRSSRRLSDSRTFVFSTDDSDDSGPNNDRWLLDFNGDFFDDGVGNDNGYFGTSTTDSIIEQRGHSRSEIWERLRGSRNERDRRTNFCPLGLHPDGSTCTCESVLIPDEFSAHASFSRIVMLAEALFEVLDEIHRQPVPLSLSMVSLPAPDSVVDSLPIKFHSSLAKTGDGVDQCYICLAEYEEGDKIRILPCHHEYHMSCVDKWLKEIHGVCPLCRGEVCDWSTSACLSNSESPSI